MSDIENIKSKLNIVDVIREYVPELKKVGRNWSARSPFRSEKTPSFMVNEELGIFKDFGGDKAGDVIKFIQEIEHLDFHNALELAAKKAGVELTNSYSKSDNFAKAKDDLYKINKFSTELYHYILTTQEVGKIALDYCLKRGLNLEIIKKYKIGYAPKNLDLASYIKKKLPEIELNLETCGLFILRTNSWITKFNDRLMFPIFDNLGQIIGFSGRVIQKGDERPKYINSPETLVFKKSNSIFNLFQAKNSVSKKDEVIITEGQIDAISSYFSGVENIVAPLGTALTLEQLKLLSRYTKNISFSLDNDEAGQKALERDYELCVTLDLRVKVIQIPTEFKDIDELIQKDKQKWTEVSKNSIDFLDFIIQKKSVGLDLNSAFDARNYRDSIFNFLKLTRDKTILAKYLKKIAEKLDQSFDEILYEFEKYLVKNTKNRFVKADSSLETQDDFENDLNRVKTLKPLDLREIYLIILNHEFPELEIEKLAQYFVTIEPNFEKLTELLQKNEYKEIAEKVAFLNLPKSIELAESEFERLAQELKINSKRKKLHELSVDFETETDSSHDLKQIDNIILT